MKKLFTFLLLSLSLSLVKADYWTQKADLPIIDGRKYAAAFSIGNKGYVATGTDYCGVGFNDLWEYDPASDSWTQKASLPAGPRFAAVAFSIGGYGYLGSGISAGCYNDFWQYDPVTNNWLQKADFGGDARCHAACFVIAGKGYIGFGRGGINFSKAFDDIWEYDPLADSWTQKINFPANGRYYGFSFVINTKGYYGCGTDSTNGVNVYDDFWEFDPVVNTWTQKANFGGGERYSLIAFSLPGSGYAGLGGSNTIGNLTDLWQYDQALNTWNQRAGFPGMAREAACSFAISKGYVCSGIVAGNNTNDLWEYAPISTTNIEELPTSNIDFTISPNPAKDFIVISYPLEGKENIEITITDAQGKKIYESNIRPLTSDLRLPTSDFSKGIYFAEVSNGKQKAVKKFVKE